MTQMTLFWTLPNTHIIHRLQECLGVEHELTVNGEQYVELDDEHAALARKYEQDGCLQIRSKKLEYINGRLQPAGADNFKNPTRL